MKGFIAAVFMLTLATARMPGQSEVLAQGNPNLTQTIVSRLEKVYSRLLDIKLDRGEQERFRKGLIVYWTENNCDGIRTSLENLKYFDAPDQVAELRASSQVAIVEGLRRDAAGTGDPVSTVLVEAFDTAHPAMRAATRERTFADLVGIWKRQDALGSRVDPNSGAAVGVSYTDSRALDITSQGTFKFVRAHNHCNGGCCRLDGSEETGSVSLVAGQLVFQTTKGSALIDDGCIGKQQRTATKPHRDSMGWSIRQGLNNNVTTLCLNTGPGKAECYEKQ